MAGGAGTRWYKSRSPAWKGLLLYAASPLVAAVMIIGIVFPYLIVLLALAAWAVPTIRRRI